MNLVDLMLHLLVCFDRKRLLGQMTQQEGVVHPMKAGLDSRPQQSQCRRAVCG